MPKHSVTQPQKSVNPNPPITPPTPLIDKVDQFAIEEKLTNACIRFVKAKKDASDSGYECMKMENAWARGGNPDYAAYVESMMAYRKALGEMSASRYDLVTLLGW